MDRIYLNQYQCERLGIEYSRPSKEKITITISDIMGSKHPSRLDQEHLFFLCSKLLSGRICLDLIPEGHGWYRPVDSVSITPTVSLNPDRACGVCASSSHVPG